MEANIKKTAALIADYNMKLIKESMDCYGIDIDYCDDKISINAPYSEAYDDFIDDKISQKKFVERNYQDELEYLEGSVINDHLDDKFDINKLVAEYLINKRKDSDTTITIDEIKKYIAAQIIVENNVYLWQQEFVDGLVKELEGNTEILFTVDEIKEAYLFVKGSINKYCNILVDDQIKKLYLDCVTKEEEKMIGKYSEDITKLSNLNPDEKEKLNKFMSENINLDEDTIVHVNHGENVDERIKYLKETLENIKGFSHVAKEVIDDKKIDIEFIEIKDEYYNIDDYNSIQTYIADYYTNIAYPNGIYHSDTIKDYINIVKSTQTYADMFEEQQEEVINQLNGLNTNKQK